MRAYKLTQIGNGWLVHQKGQELKWHFPDLELALEWIRRGNPKKAVTFPPTEREVAFRNGGSQIDIEEFTREQSQG